MVLKNEPAEVESVRNSVFEAERAARSGDHGVEALAVVDGELLSCPPFFAFQGSIVSIET